jgi:hypothetical protein
MACQNHLSTPSATGSSSSCSGTLLRLGILGARAGAPLRAADADLLCQEVGPDHETNAAIWAPIVSQVG